LGALAARLCSHGLQPWRSHHRSDRLRPILRECRTHEPHILAWSSVFLSTLMGTLSTVVRGWPAAILLLGSLLLGVACPRAQAAEAPRRFDIPAEPVDVALNEFARQADVTLLFSSTLVASVRTPGVHGNLTVTSALGQLLGGTGLGFRQVSPSAIAIVESSSQVAGAGGRAAPPQSASRGAGAVAAGGAR